MTSAEYCLYDNPGFFGRYQEMRQRGAGLNEDLERPAIVRLLRAALQALTEVPS